MAGRVKRNAPTKFKAYETTSVSGEEKGYMRVTKSLHYSDAVSDLTNVEYRIFMDMKHRSNGHDEVVYTQEMAMKATNCCKSTYTSTMNKLVMVGLVKRKCITKKRRTFFPPKQ